MAADDRTVETTSYRVGAAALGMFSGCAAGFFVLILVGYLAKALPSIPVLLLGGAGAGAVTGFVYPEVAFLLAGAVAHFIAGLLVAAHAPDSAFESLTTFDRDAKDWLKAAFWFGVLYGAVVGVACWLGR